MLGALGFVMEMGCCRVVVLWMVVVMSVGLLLESGLLVLTSFLLLVLLLLFQPLFSLSNPNELDPPLLSTQNHFRVKKG